MQDQYLTLRVWWRACTQLLPSVFAKGIQSVFQAKHQGKGGSNLLMPLYLALKPVYLDVSSPLKTLLLVPKPVYPERL